MNCERTTATAARCNRMVNPVWLIALLVLFTALPGFGQASKEREKLQKSKQKLEQEIRYTTELLEKTRSSKAVSESRIKVLTRQIRTREALIRAINRELDDMAATIVYDSLQIARLSGQLSKLRSEYARLITYAWRTMNGNNKLMFIFSAHDFNQAYLRLKYYQQYSAYRRQQAEKIETTKRSIEAHRSELETTRAGKMVLVQEKQSEKQKLDREKDTRSQAVKEMTAKEKQLLATIRTKQQAAQQLEGAIAKVIADEIRASEERARKKEAAERKGSSAVTTTVTPGKMNYTPKELELSSSFSANRGKLPWPCEKGFISGDFGEHPHPVLQHVKVKNNGIDIMTEPGAAVRTVFGGRVSRVMSFPTLHNVVIIRHGEYLTVYSNLASVKVKEGDEVAVKQVIGSVYAPAGEQKAELHFELWRGKVIQDPEPWLSGR